MNKMTLHKKGVEDLEWGCGSVGQGRNQGRDVSVGGIRRNDEIFPKEMLCVVLCFKGPLSVTVTICLIALDFLWKGEQVQQKHGMRTVDPRDLCTLRTRPVGSRKAWLTEHGLDLPFELLLVHWIKPNKNSTQIIKWIEKTMECLKCFHLANDAFST